MINPETLKREKMLFAYTTALEQGDFARLADDPGNSAQRCHPGEADH